MEMTSMDQPMTSLDEYLSPGSLLAHQHRHHPVTMGSHPRPSSSEHQVFQSDREHLHGLMMCPKMTNRPMAKREADTQLPEIAAHYPKGKLRLVTLQHMTGREQREQPRPFRVVAQSRDQVV